MTLKDIAQMTKLEERAEKAEAEREKLIEVLEKIIDIEYTQHGYDFAVALGEAQNIARAVLVGVKEQGK